LTLPEKFTTLYSMTEEVSEIEHIKETSEEELKRWFSSFDTDNLAHAILERETMISLLQDFLKVSKEGALKNRAEEFLKGIK